MSPEPLLLTPHQQPPAHGQMQGQSRARVQLYGITPVRYRLADHARHRFLHIEPTWLWAAAFTICWHRPTDPPAVT
ncbi:hypothetical protein ABZ642_13570 [Streptomyces sp. NPDC007157]|uniref:hypothetical protein n=1 Tax=Streptomyces sp. NPDC007157 TaxID=3154681 RepID=UPI0033D61907